MKPITTYKRLLITTLLVTFRARTAMSMSAEQLSQRKPHVILIVADDLGWNDVSWNNPSVVTPHMDALAKNGVILNQSYVQPTCTPTRTALLTGKYPFRFGLQKGVIAATEPRGVPLQAKMLPKLLKKVGYETHAIGKWHLGFCSWDYTPTKRGFDNFYGFYNGAEDYYRHTRDIAGGPRRQAEKRSHAEGFLDLRNNTTPDGTKKGIYSTHLFASVTEDILKKRKSQDPLFMYLAFQSVHTPLQVPQNYSQVYRHIKDKDRRTYLGMVTAMDEAVGRLVKALKRTGHYKNSVIIFTTDNGGSTKNGASNWPLRGRKSSLWEGGVRGPAFIHSPFLPNPGTINNQLHYAADWFRTIVDITGSPSPKVDGIGQWDSIAGLSESARDRIIFNMYSVKAFKACIRLGDYKMLVGHMTGGTWAPSADSPNRSSHNAGNKVHRPVWPNNWLPAILSARNNDELNGGLNTFNDTYENISNELYTEEYDDYFPSDTATSTDAISLNFTSRNFEPHQENKRKGKQANGDSYILWRVLKKHPMLKWQPKVLKILGQQMRDFTKIRLFNIKEDPEERNELSTTQINRLQTMLNYLSRQLRYMVSVPVKRNVRAAHPKYWNEVWSPGWCQATS